MSTPRAGCQYAAHRCAHHDAPDDSGLILRRSLRRFMLRLFRFIAKTTKRERVYAEAESQQSFAALDTVKFDDRDNMQPGEVLRMGNEGVPIRASKSAPDLEKESQCLVRRFVLEQPGESVEDQRKRRRAVPAQKRFPDSCDFGADAKELYQRAPCIPDQPILHHQHDGRV